MAQVAAGVKISAKDYCAMTSALICLRDQLSELQLRSRHLAGMAGAAILFSPAEE
jgi:hypothetical protein